MYNMNLNQIKIFFSGGVVVFLFCVMDGSSLIIINAKTTFQLNISHKPKFKVRTPHLQTMPIPLMAYEEET